MNEIVLRDVVIPLPGELPIACRPTISLSVIVQASHLHSPCSLPSAISSAGPYVDEVVAVLINGDPSSEKSLRVLLQQELASKPITIIPTNPASHPHLYDIDSPAFFSMSRSNTLAGEDYVTQRALPWTELPFVTDWSGLHNLGLSNCTQEWRLSLDGDSRLARPELLPGLCSLLDGQQRDVCYLTRFLPKGRVVHASHLSRNIPALRWEGVNHESLEGGIRPAIVDGGTTILSQTSERLQGSWSFRPLYFDARRQQWDIPPANLLHMARSAYDSLNGYPSQFEIAAIERHLELSLLPEERAWACAIRGELSERDNHPSTASFWYEMSVEEFPCWKSYYRLARSRFKEQLWQSCLDAYDRGLELADQIPTIDDGSENSKTSLFFAAISLHELGRHSDCQKACQTLLQLFPDNTRVSSLCQRLR